MEPQNKPSEPPREHQSLILQPTDEAAFLKEMEVDRLKSVQAQEQAVPQQPVVTPIESQAVATPVSQYATYAPPQPLAGVPVVEPEPIAPHVRWGYLLLIGALIPIIVTVFGRLVELFLSSDAIFMMAILLGPLSGIIFIFLNLLPLFIAYKFVTKRLREKLFLDHARLIFFATCSFLLTAKFMSGILVAVIFSNTTVEIQGWVPFAFEVGLTLLSSMVGIVIITLVTNVWNRNHPVRRQVIAWGIFAFPIVLALAIFISASVYLRSAGQL